jgi:hypothetical protein
MLCCAVLCPQVKFIPGRPDAMIADQDDNLPKFDDNFHHTLFYFLGNGKLVFLTLKKESCMHMANCMVQYDAVGRCRSGTMLTSLNLMINFHRTLYYFLGNGKLMGSTRLELCVWLNAWCTASSCC